jgi:hypothetical protein
VRLTQQQLTLLRRINEAGVILEDRGRWTIEAEEVPEVIVESLKIFGLITERGRSVKVSWILTDDGVDAIRTNEVPRHVVKRLCEAREQEAQGARDG